jgi:hypothetical protein
LADILRAALRDLGRQEGISGQGAGGSDEYGLAAEPLATCAGLAARIDGFGRFDTQDALVTRLRSAYGRTSGFRARATG